MRRASTVCAISSRKKQKVPRPSALARYSAMSAFFSSVSALMPRRGHGDADAGADLDQMIVDLVAFAQAVDDAAGKARRILVRLDVLLEHDEFVAAEASDEILRPQHFAQAVGDRAQQLVAAGMAERVVDLLELVEIDEQQRRQLRRHHAGIASRRSISSRKLTRLGSAVSSS